MLKTTYEQIIDPNLIATKEAGNNLKQVIEWAQQEEVKPAVEDGKKVLLLCIDMQQDFMEGGSLEVPNSKQDVKNVTRFIYDNLDKISQIMCSLDTHSPQQIFHPCWWKDAKGETVSPYTVITQEEVTNGKYVPVFYPAKSLKYLEELERQSKKQLCVWPYHCIAGTSGANLEGEFTKMLYFHSVARASKVRLIPKGTDPLSEMYGIIKPEYDGDCHFINNTVLKAVEEYDEIYIVGEAASHCLLESAKQIMEYFANRPEVTEKITILEDCTSPITGFERDTKQAFEDLKQSYGIRICASTDVTL